MRMSAIPMPLSVFERGKLIKSIQFSPTHSPLIGDSSVVVCILDKTLPFLLCRYLTGVASYHPLCRGPYSEGQPDILHKSFFFVGFKTSWTFFRPSLPFIFVMSFA
jgi:hypothetical protein